MRRSWYALLLPLLTAVGCTETKPTGVVLKISTDLAIPSEVDGIAIRIDGDGEKALDRSYKLAGSGALKLPGTLTVTGDPGSTVLMTVVGRRDGRDIITAQARVVLEEQELLWVPIELLRSCVGVDCSDGESCTAGGCVDIDLQGSNPSNDSSTSPDAGADVADSAVDSVVPADTGACVHPDVSANCSDGWCNIPAGCFVMGTHQADSCRGNNEFYRQVTLTRAFEIMRFEATQEQFEDLLGYNPTQMYLDPLNPVDDGRWYHAVAYCNALSEAAGLEACYACEGYTCETLAKWNEPWWKSAITLYDCPGYRLPTEAEWEYAYRAGTVGAYYVDGLQCNDNVGVCEIGWHRACTSKLHQVGLKKPNGWGLYDMAGNAAEWVHDIFEKSPDEEPTTNPIAVLRGDTEYRVVRGGSHRSVPTDLRAAAREYQGPSAEWAGFRCARTLP